MPTCSVCASEHRHKIEVAAIATAQKPRQIDLEALQRSEAEGILCQLVSARARLAIAGEKSAQLGNTASVGNKIGAWTMCTAVPVRLKNHRLVGGRTAPRRCGDPIDVVVACTLNVFRG